MFTSRGRFNQRVEEDRGFTDNFNDRRQLDRFVFVPHFLIILKCCVKVLGCLLGDSLCNFLAEIQQNVVHFAQWTCFSLEGVAMNVTEVVKGRDVEEVKQVQVDAKVTVKDLEAKTVIEEKGVDPYHLNQNI